MDGWKELKGSQFFSFEISEFHKIFIGMHTITIWISSLHWFWSEGRWQWVFWLLMWCWMQSQHKLRIIWIRGRWVTAVEGIWKDAYLGPMEHSGTEGKLASLTLCVCVCVFKLTKWRFSLMLCSQRSLLVPAWSLKHMVPGFQWIYEPLSKREKRISGWQNTNWMLLLCPSSAGFLVHVFTCHSYCLKCKSSSNAPNQYMRCFRSTHTHSFHAAG